MRKALLQAGTASALRPFGPITTSPESSAHARKGIVEAGIDLEDGGEAGKLEHVRHHGLHGAEGQYRSSGLACLAHGKYAAQSGGAYVFKSGKVDDDTPGSGVQDYGLAQALMSEDDDFRMPVGETERYVYFGQGTRVDKTTGSVEQYRLESR